MAKKKKHKESSGKKSGFLVLLSTAIVLAAMIVPFAIRSTSSPAFATEPWLNPHQICTTQWVYPVFDENNPELMDALAAQNLRGFSVSVVTEEGRSCYDSYGRPLTRHHDIRVSFVWEESVELDDRVLSNTVYKVMRALHGTETAEAWTGIDVLTVSFYNGTSQRSWHMNYEQAVEAYEAGVRGFNFFYIGSPDSFVREDSSFR